MKIDAIRISVFETQSHSPPFQLAEEELRSGQRRWLRRPVNLPGAAQDHLHVLHVHTDAGIEGVCTVGDARYRTMRAATWRNCASWRWARTRSTASG